MCASGHATAPSPREMSFQVVGVRKWTRYGTVVAGDVISGCRCAQVDAPRHRSSGGCDFRLLMCANGCTEAAFVTGVSFQVVDAQVDAHGTAALRVLRALRVRPSLEAGVHDQAGRPMSFQAADVRKWTSPVTVRTQNGPATKHRRGAVVHLLKCRRAGLSPWRRPAPWRASPRWARAPTGCRRSRPCPRAGHPARRRRATPGWRRPRSTRTCP